MIRMEKKRDDLLKFHQKDSDLPFGFKRCEFLRSTGQQFIESDLQANNNLCLYFKFRITEKVPNAGTNIFPIAYYSSTSRYRPLKFETGEFRIHEMNSTNIINRFKQDFDIHTLLYNDSNGNAFFDGENVGKVFRSMNKTDNLGLGIFGQSQIEDNRHYAQTSLTKLEIYSIIAYDKITNKVIENLIPCLDRKGTPCFFETKNWKIYYDTIKQAPFEYELLN